MAAYVPLREAISESVPEGDFVQSAQRRGKIISKLSKMKERGDSVVELDNFKSTLLSYKTPLQEVRDSL
jgi:hypothetical protein